MLRMLFLLYNELKDEKRGKGTMFFLFMQKILLIFLDRYSNFLQI